MVVALMPLWWVLSFFMFLSSSIRRFLGSSGLTFFNDHLGLVLSDVLIDELEKFIHRDWFALIYRKPEVDMAPLTKAINTMSDE